MPTSKPVTPPTPPTMSNAEFEKLLLLAIDKMESGPRASVAEAQAAKAIYIPHAARFAAELVRDEVLRRKPVTPPETRDKLIYLATPYSHPDKAVMEQRFNQAATIAAKLMGEGNFVFCPITHTHPIAVHGELPRGWDFWEQYDRVMLRACTKVIVAKMEGWEQSKGIAGELKIAAELGLPIEYMEVADFHLSQQSEEAKRCCSEFQGLRCVLKPGHEERHRDREDVSAVVWSTSDATNSAALLLRDCADDIATAGHLSGAQLQRLAAYRSRGGKS